MAVGISSDSILWVAGESMGKNTAGSVVALPEDVIPSGLTAFLTEDFATQTYVDDEVADVASDANLALFSLRQELVASGYLSA